MTKLEFKVLAFELSLSIYLHLFLSDTHSFSLLPSLLLSLCQKRGGEKKSTELNRSAGLKTLLVFFSFMCHVVFKPSWCNSSCFNTQTLETERTRKSFK